MAYYRGKKRTKAGSGKRKRKNLDIEFDPNKIYLQGRIYEALPGTRFKVRVERPGDLDDIMVDCKLRTVFKLKHINMIKGDTVTVEIDPNQDLTNGTIVMLKRSFTKPPKVNK